MNMVRHVHLKSKNYPILCHFVRTNFLLVLNVKKSILFTVKG